MTIQVDELPVRNVELEEEGPSRLQKIMGLLETARDGRVISEQVQGVVGNKDVIELCVKGHPGHVHADIRWVVAVGALSLRQHVRREIKTGNKAAVSGKGLTDSPCAATEL